MTKPVIAREDALALLREHMPVLRARFGIAELALFGSTARDQATADSDVDILVTFDRPPEAVWSCYAAQSYLADVFGRPVDLVERRLLRKEYIPWIEADEIDPLNPRPTMPNGSRPKRWDVHIQDMERYCRQTIAFAAGMSYEDYLDDEKTLAATSFYLSQLGEAANKLPESVRQSHPEIAWSRMIGLRHLIVHAYGEIEYAQLWEIIQTDLPELAKRLVPILAEAQAQAHDD